MILTPFAPIGEMAKRQPVALYLRRMSQGEMIHARHDPDHRIAAAATAAIRVPEGACP